MLWDALGNSGELCEVLGSFWKLWEALGFILGLFWGVILGSLWGSFLGHFWGHFGAILGTLWGSFWGHFGVLLGLENFDFYIFLPLVGTPELF